MDVDTLEYVEIHQKMVANVSFSSMDFVYGHPWLLIGGAYRKRARGCTLYAVWWTHDGVLLLETTVLVLNTHFCELCRHERCHSFAHLHAFLLEHVFTHSYARVHSMQHTLCDILTQKIIDVEGLM